LPKGDARLQAAEPEIGGEMIVRRVYMCRCAFWLRKKEKNRHSIFFSEINAKHPLIPANGSKRRSIQSIDFYIRGLFPYLASQNFLGK